MKVSLKNSYYKVVLFEKHPKHPLKINIIINQTFSKNDTAITNFLLYGDNPKSTL